MSGEHFTGGPMPHTPEKRLEATLYSEVQKHVVYACTDVALRNRETGEIFLGSRQTEPQLGPWFIGGRNVYGKGISDNAALQVQHDFGLDLPERRFAHVSTYSTDFPIAEPGQEDHGRHTLNATMLIDLSPAEVAALEENMKSEKVSAEYSAGRWYDPAELARESSDTPYVIKQFVRDLGDHDLLQDARYDAAKAEDKKRHENPRVPETNPDEAIILADAAAWVDEMTQQLSPDEARALLGEIDANTQLGDQQIKKMLRSRELPLPKFESDNGPRLRALVKAASQAIQLSDKQS